MSKDNNPFNLPEPQWLDGIDQKIFQDLKIVEEKYLKKDNPFMDYLIAKLRAYTGLSLEVNEIIIAAFFEEIKKQMFESKIVKISNFGWFLITGPQTNNSKVVSIRFFSQPNLMNNLNNDL